MTAATRDTAGRFTRAPHPCCETCGSLLHRRLWGEQVCVMRWCALNGQVVTAEESAE